MIIGLCGKSGSGKSSIAKKLLEIYKEDAIHIDVDKIGHAVNEIPEVKKQLVRYFGERILTNGMIDRRILAKIVFSDKKEMGKLTEYTWPAMKREILSQLSSDKKVIIIDWLLLPKTEVFNLCDLKVYVDIPYEERLRRVIQRDKISKSKFDLRESQSPNYDYSIFDVIMYKEDSIEKVVRKI